MKTATRRPSSPPPAPLRRPPVSWALPARGTAQGKEIVMLGIWPFTGPFADVGPLLDRGMRLAIEEWGNKVIGRPIKYITRDDETKASSATRRMEEAIDSEGVKVVIGPWSSGVALACTEVAKRRKVFYYFSGGTEEIAGKRCHRYAFNWAASPYTAMHVVVDNYMKLNPTHKKWYLFVNDYAFGWSVEKYTREARAAARHRVRRRRPHAPRHPRVLGLRQQGRRRQARRPVPAQRGPGRPAVDPRGAQLRPRPQGDHPQ